MKPIIVQKEYLKERLMMYEELVERLRNHAIRSDNGYEIGNSMYLDILKAADALEAMSEYVNTMRRLKSEGWYLQQTKFHNGYQALTTMPLPEPPKEE